MIEKPVQLLSQSQLAALAGVTARRIREMKTESKDPPPEVRDAEEKLLGYNPAEVGEWLKRRYTPDDERLDAQQEQARLSRERRLLTALDRKKRDGELIELELAKQHVSTILGHVKSRMLSVPSRVAPRLVGITSTKEIQSAVRQAVHDALRQSGEELQA